MLFTPNGPLPPKKSKTGIARGRGSTGHWLRSRANVLQPRSPASLLWRQIFHAAKSNVLSVGTYGNNTTPVMGVTPAGAWFTQSITYIGVFVAGLFQGAFQLENSLRSCATPAAYQVMVQTTAAALDLGTIPTPPITATAATAVTGTTTDTSGIYSLTCQSENPYGYGLLNPGAQLILKIASGAIAAPPAMTHPAGYGVTWPNLEIALTQGQSFTTTAPEIRELLIDPYGTLWTWSIGTLPTGVTATLNTQVFPQDIYDGPNASYALTLTASPAATPGTYTIAITTVSTIGTITSYLTVEILAAATNTYTAAITGLPSGVTAAIAGLDQPPLWPLARTTLIPTYDSSVPGLSGGLTVVLTLPVTLAAGTYTGTATLTGNGQTLTGTFSFTVASTTLQCALQSPVFQIAQTLYASTIVDSDYNAQAWTLTMDSTRIANGPMFRNGNPITGVGVVVASAAYGAYTAAPPLAQWQTVAIHPGYANVFQLLRSEWEAVWGPLPDTGSMKIGVYFVDALTGCPGPMISCTAGWTKGTLRGVTLANWPGPAFVFPPLGISALIVAPQDVTFTFPIAGSLGYGGTIAFSLVGGAPVPNGNNNITNGVPAGLTAVFTPATLTIAPGDTTVYNIGVTLSAAAGALEWNANVGIKATDTIQTVTQKFPVEVTGDTVPQLPVEFVGMTPVLTEVYIPASSTTTLEFLLYNTGADDQTVYVMDNNTDPDFTTSYDQSSYTVPGGSPAAPGTATITLTITQGATFSQPLPQLQVIASPGKYNCNAIVNLDANPGNGFQLSPQLASVNLPVPGSVGITFTLSNTNTHTLTPTLSALDLPNGITAAWSTTTPTIPAAVGGVPGTTTVTLTLTATAEADTSENYQGIQAILGSYIQSAQILFTDNQYGPLWMQKTPQFPVQPIPGSVTVTLTVYNESGSATTVTFGTTPLESGISVAFSSPTASVAAGATGAPSTASVTAVITATSGADPAGALVHFTGTASGYGELVA